MLLKKVQIEYEKLLKLREGEEKLSKIYMKKKEEVTKDSKNDDKTTIAKQKEEQLTKKFQEIKATSEKRFARFLEAKDEARNLYLYDLQEMNKNPAQRQFKRAFFAHLDMGIQEELTELELETMTLGEIWEYNKCYLERKEAKHLKRKIKKKAK